ncbi:MAG: lysoplasmalogenase, partial [Chloroflexota bacterium]
AWSGGLAGAYGLRLFLGLVVCMIGDIALIPKGRTWFLAGLVSFLLGHVLYVLAFNGLVYLTSLNLLVVAVILVTSGGVLAWLWPHLGSMRIPVLAYVAVISAMVWSAWAVFFNSGLPLTARLLIGLGATCFYFSDIFVARNAFVKEGFANKAWGRPLYYLGQFLLAFSVAAVGQGGS